MQINSMQFIKIKHNKLFVILPCAILLSLKLVYTTTQFTHFRFKPNDNSEFLNDVKINRTNFMKYITEMLNGVDYCKSKNIAVSYNSSFVKKKIFIATLEHIKYA